MPFGETLLPPYKFRLRHCSSTLSAAPPILLFRRLLFISLPLYLYSLPPWENDVELRKLEAAV